MKKISILDLAEDLLESDPVNTIPQAPPSQRKRVIDKKTLITKPKTMETLISDASQVIGIDPQELQDWIAECSVPQVLLKPMLLTAKRLGLNPLLDHLAWELNLEGDWELFLPIDAWITLINREEKFQGMTFNQSSQMENGIPIWMECSIYRCDLTYPITVREYFIELKTEHPMWAQMPRRMLRHKTVQQCARLAFGISVPKIKISKPNQALSKMGMHAQNVSVPNVKQILKEKLISESTYAR